MKLAVLGAFPFPLPQGSQLYARDQLRALAAAGADPVLFCYGRGEGSIPEDIDAVPIPRALSPRALGTGPALGKPVADAALAAAFAASARRRRFDAALAHNAEAALAALLVRPLTGVPVVYVAHTLLGEELSSFAPRVGSLVDRIGRSLDRALAARADGVLVLCRAAEERLAPHARGPLVRILPGLDPRAAPTPEETERACARHGLVPGRFALYTGNLDGYQELDALADAARRVPDVPVVVATHAADRLDPALRAARSDDPDEARRLLFGAGVFVLPRRRPGGFPIKLLNAMEAGRAIVARGTVADGLVHDRSAWLLPADAGPDAFAAAIAALLGDPTRSARLGSAARETLETHHAWPRLAERTLELVQKLIRPEG